MTGKNDDLEPAEGCCSQVPVSRRTVVSGLGTLGLFSLVGSPAFAQGADGPQAGDLLVRNGDDTNTPLTVEDVISHYTPADAAAKAPGTFVVFAFDAATNTVRKGNLNKIALVRMEPEGLPAEVAERSAEGVLAFSAICTHAGCEVKTFRPESNSIFCPCHGSAFSLLDGKVVSPPAKSPLASLALKVEDGKLVVASAFEGKVGAQG